MVYSLKTSALEYFPTSRNHALTYAGYCHTGSIFTVQLNPGQVVGFI